MIGKDEIDESMMTERGICTYSYAYLTYWNVIQYKYVIYNSLFININSRSLSSEEVNCTTACVDKTMNFNNRVSALLCIIRKYMRNYMHEWEPSFQVNASERVGLFIKKDLAKG